MVSASVFVFEPVASHLAVPSDPLLRPGTAAGFASTALAVAARLPQWQSCLRLIKPHLTRLPIYCCAARFASAVDPSVCLCCCTPAPARFCRLSRRFYDPDFARPLLRPGLCRPRKLTAAASSGTRFCCEPPAVSLRVAAHGHHRGARFIHAIRCSNPLTRLKPRRP